MKYFKGRLGGGGGGGKAITHLSVPSHADLHKIQS